MLSRDHHDVSGTDSPFRETSNIYDGSALCAGNYIFFLSLLTLTMDNVPLQGHPSDRIIGL